MQVSIPPQILHGFQTLFFPLMLALWILLILPLKNFPVARSYIIGFIDRVLFFECASPGPGLPLQSGLPSSTNA